MPLIDYEMPLILRELHLLDFDYANGTEIDFEPFDAFLSAGDTKEWIQAWTGNDKIDGAEFRIFGQDGSGGNAGFWLIRPENPILQQPIVFLGSEGARGIVATNFSDYLWLLAVGFGPFEAISYPTLDRPTNPIFNRFAELHADLPRKNPQVIMALAQSEFPNFSEYIESICR